MLNILLSVFEDDPLPEDESRPLIHVKLAVRGLGVTSEQLRRLTIKAKIEWFDDDHLVLEDYEALLASRKKGKNPQTRLFLIDGEIYVTIVTAAIILQEKFATLWKWVVYDHLLTLYPYYRGGLVKLTEVNLLKQTPFFSQRRYSYSEIGTLYKVSRQTVRSWDKKKSVETTTGPGGQKYVLESELPRCKELSKIAHNFSPKKSND